MDVFKEGFSKYLIIKNQFFLIPKKGLPPLILNIPLVKSFELTYGLSSTLVSSSITHISLSYLSGLQDEWCAHIRSVNTESDGATVYILGQ